MTSDCLCLMLGLPCECVRRGPGGFGYRPHGTLAAARRHYRRGEAACEACRQAEADARRDRVAAGWVRPPRVGHVHAVPGGAVKALCGIRARNTTDLLHEVTCGLCLAVAARHAADDQARARRAAA